MPDPEARNNNATRHIMVERASFLTAAYSAYHHRGMPAEDQEMTRIGPGTPCGEYTAAFLAADHSHERIG
jgi:hypothetical protein